MKRVILLLSPISVICCILLVAGMCSSSHGEEQKERHNLNNDGILNLDIDQSKELMQERLNRLLELNQKAPSSLVADAELENIWQHIEISKQLYELATERFQNENNLGKSEILLERTRSFGSLKTAFGEISQLKKQFELADHMVALASKIVHSYEKDRDLLAKVVGQTATLGQNGGYETEFIGIQKALALAKINNDICLFSFNKERESLRAARIQLIQRLCAIVGVLLLIYVIRFLAIRKVDDTERRYYANRVSLSIAIFALLIGLMIIFIRDFSNLMTGMGIAFAGLLITLQEIIASFSAWFIIRSGRGYRVGDWVSIGPQYGEVVDIGLLTTCLSQVSPFSADHSSGGGFTGGLTIFPNNQVLKESVTNFTRGYPFIWCRMTFAFTYESNWKRAEEILLEALDIEEISNTAQQARVYVENMASDFMIRMESTNPRLRIAAGSNGIETTLLFLTHPRRRQDLVDRIHRGVLQKVEQEPKTDFAYDTVRMVSESNEVSQIEKNKR